MKDKPPISARTQYILANDICKAVNALVEYQFRLHPRVLHDAVGLQSEAYRLRFITDCLVDRRALPEPEPVGRRRNAAKAPK